MSEVSENKPPVLSRTSFLFYYMNEKMHAFDVILFNFFQNVIKNEQTFYTDDYSAFYVYIGQECITI